MKTIIFREKYWRVLSRLEATDRLMAYDAIMAVVFTNDFVDIPKEVEPIVSLICISIEEDYAKYEAARM